MPVPPGQRGTQQRKIRVDDQLWNDLGELAAAVGSDRSSIIRELAEAWCKRTRKQLERDAALQQLRAVTRA